MTPETSNAFTTFLKHSLSTGRPLHSPSFTQARSIQTTIITLSTLHGFPAERFDMIPSNRVDSDKCVLSMTSKTLQGHYAQYINYHCVASFLV